LDISDAIYIAPSLEDLVTWNVGIENLQGWFLKI
jgi:hypothetical protein